MLALTLYAFFGGYALFLLGFAIFMYFENQKFGDNQFTMKLLPPPPRLETPAAREAEPAAETPAAPKVPLSPIADWTPVPVARPAVRTLA